METAETPRETLERLGAAKVRLLYGSGSLPTYLMASAPQWLAELEEEERARNESYQAEQYRTARIAKNAAIVAAVAAIIAVPLAIISIIISYLAWTRPGH